MVGGSPKVINKFLKKPDAAKALSDRAVRFYEKNFEEASDNENYDMPAELGAFLNPIFETMEQVKAEDDGFIVRCLKTVSTDKLNTTLEIMKETQGRHSEEKVINVIQQTYPLLETIAAATHHVEKTKHDLVKLMLTKYSQEFQCYKGGEAIFDNSKFRDAVTKELNKREAVAEYSAEMSEPVNRACNIQ